MMSAIIYMLKGSIKMVIYFGNETVLQYVWQPGISFVLILFQMVLGVPLFHG